MALTACNPVPCQCLLVRRAGGSDCTALLLCRTYMCRNLMLFLDQTQAYCRVQSLNGGRTHVQLPGAELLLVQGHVFHRAAHYCADDQAACQRQAWPHQEGALQVDSQHSGTWLTVEGPNILPPLQLGRTREALCRHTASIQAPAATWFDCKAAGPVPKGPLSVHPARWELTFRHISLAAGALAGHTTTSAYGQ